MNDNELRNLHLSSSAIILEKPPGPRSRELLQKQEHFESAAVSYPKAIPIAFAEGKGATLKDVDGNIYIDFFAGAGVVNIGHCNPEVVEAAREQMGILTHNKQNFPSSFWKYIHNFLRGVSRARLRQWKIRGPARLSVLS